MQAFGMSSLDTTPLNTELFPEQAVKLDSIQRQNVLLLAVKELLNRFVDLSSTMNPPSKPDNTVKHDHVQGYEVLSTVLLLMEFADSIRGDGERIIQC